jgi:hypothetical protein
MSSQPSSSVRLHLYIPSASTALTRPIDTIPLIHIDTLGSEARIVRPGGGSDGGIAIGCQSICTGDKAGEDLQVKFSNLIYAVLEGDNRIIIDYGSSPSWEGWWMGKGGEKNSGLLGKVIEGVGKAIEDDVCKACVAACVIGDAGVVVDLIGMEEVKIESGFKGMKERAIGKVKDAVEAVGVIRDGLGRLAQEGKVQLGKFHACIRVRTWNSHTQEELGTFQLIHLASCRADRMGQDPDIQKTQELFKNIQTYLVHQPLQSEHPSASKPLLQLLWPVFIKKPPVDFVIVVKSTEEDYALNLKVFEYAKGLRAVPPTATVGNRRKSQILPNEDIPGVYYQQESDSLHNAQAEKSHQQDGASELKSTKPNAGERRSSFARRPSDQGNPSFSKPKSSHNVHFNDSSAPMQKELHKELYEDDDSLYDKISLFKDMRSEKKRVKKPMVHGVFNDMMGKGRGVPTAFWTYNLDVHHGGDVELVNRLHRLNEKVDPIAKKVVQTECCKKMQNFLQNGFTPMFHDGSNNHREYDEEMREGESLNEVIDMI